jgi:hypothetical protein
MTIGHTAYNNKTACNQSTAWDKAEKAYAAVLRIRDVYPLKLIYYNSLQLVK